MFLTQAIRTDLNNERAIINTSSVLTQAIRTDLNNERAIINTSSVFRYGWQT